MQSGFLRRGFAGFLIMAMIAGCGPVVTEKKASLDFLWVSRPKGRFEGGMSHAEVLVEPSKKPGLKVGIIETKVAGTGASWRATMWMSVFLGSFFAGKLPSDYLFLFETETLSEKVDGPSAGGLFTVAVIAALRGHAVRTDATMTGTINPDGSIGPVDGVVQKFDAAITKGKKRLGYPPGMRMALDLSTRRKVDLEAFARQRGAEAREVADIYEAYEYMTGHKLPKKAMLKPTEMDLDRKTYDFLARKAGGWRQRTEDLYKGWQRLKTKPPGLDDLWNQANTLYQRSYRLTDQKLIAASYMEALQGYTLAAVAFNFAAFDLAVLKGDWMGAFKLVARAMQSGETGFRSLVTAMDRVPIRSAAEAVQVLDSYEAILHAFGSLQMASQNRSSIWGQMGGIPKNMSKSTLARFASALRKEARFKLWEMTVADVYFQVARDYLDLVELVDGGKKPLSPDTFKEVLGLYEALAEANLEYFDAVYLGSKARRKKKNKDLIKGEFMQSEIIYRNALLNLRLPKKVFQNWTKEDSQSHLMARLSGSLSSFFSSSALIARYISLEIRKSGNKIRGVRHGKALTSMLELGERSARIHAAMARKYIGTVPLSARMEYELGRYRRNLPQLEDKLDALSHFWRSSKWSQLAIAINRYSKKK